MHFTPREVEMANEDAPELIDNLRNGEWNRVNVSLSGDPPLDDVLAQLGDAGNSEG